MIQKKIDKLRKKLKTSEQVRLLDQIEKEINRMEVISNKYCVAFTHCLDGMDAQKSAEEVGLLKKGIWV